MRPEFDPERERAFIDAVLAHGKREVEDLVDRLGCVPRMLAARNAKLGSPLSAEELRDATQDTFVVILERLPSYRAIAPLESWIYGICCRQILAARREKHRRAGRVRALVSEASVPDNALPSLEDPSEAERYLAGLGGLEARIIRFKHMEGLTFDEVATRLGLSPNTAKTSYYRGMRKLRASLEREKRGES